MSVKSEVTWQSIVGALVVSTIISLAYPYIVLKLGMGPNVSVLAAFLGALFLSVTARKTKGQNAVQNNVIQSAATSAASTAFMCVVAAAFGYLAMNESVPAEAQVHIGPWQMFFWLTCSGAIGVFFSALFRKYFIEDPQMIFADGVAAAETINVLDEAGGTGGGRIRTLGLSAGVGAVVAFFRDGLPFLATWNFAGRFSIGMEWNVLSIGTGMLIGINVGLSMLLGTAVVWLFGPKILDMAGQQIVLSNVAPQYVEQVRALIAPGIALTQEQSVFLAQHGGLAMKYVTGNHFSIAMMWFMWPATAVMVTAALTAVLLQWKSLMTMFRGLTKAKGAVHATDEDVSLRTVILMSILFTFLLAVFQYLNFDLPIWQTIAAVVLGLPLILVGVRVLGETNNGPVSLMANSVQVIFRAFSPLIGHNLVAAGMSGNINSQGEGLMQVYRTGKMVGSTPRILTWVQFWAVGIGAAAVAVMYPILTNRYRLGEELVAPTGLKLSNMAVLMSKGLAAFPPGALLWTVIAAIAGVVITLMKDKLKWYWLPSAAGFGFALILPGTLNLAVGIGAVIGWIWSKYSQQSYENHSITVASGFIGGEALVAGLILPVAFYFGWLG
jgi:uncharacterized oligopeptide transporter (OPT) family protein